jgi:hypothetical protein
VQVSARDPVKPDRRKFVITGSGGVTPPHVLVDASKKSYWYPTTGLFALDGLLRANGLCRPVRIHG